jgi:hypothetical protein
MKYIYSYYQTKSTIIQWYIATTLGILGNILVTVIFIEHIQPHNLVITLIIMVLIVMFTRLGIIYMPFHSLRRLIIDDYMEFPKHYEKYIDETKINDPILKMEVMSSYLNNLITEYGRAIRYCIFKDSLIKVLSETKYITIKDIFIPSEYNPSLEIIFTTNFYALIDPDNQEKIKNEFTRLNGAIFNAKQISGIYAFELDEQEWIKNGNKFINNISGIDFDKIVKYSIEEIKNSTKFSFRKDVKKRLKNKIYKQINQ